MNAVSNNAAAEQVFARLCEQYLERYLERQRRIKLEIAVVAFLWLVGCPVLCIYMPGSDTLYNVPNEEFCGLPLYSISASMTGRYPKILGSILAPLFALLVVQRSSCGLCSILKLGWMVRFSPMVTLSNKDESRRAAAAQQQDHQPKTQLAVELWNRIERIEFLGYVAAFFLIALVAFDARDFTKLHTFLATIAFFALSKQNRLIGSLEDDFGSELFPNWFSGDAARAFYFGLAHLGVMYVGCTVLGTLSSLDRCNGMLSILESTSVKVFDNPTTVSSLASLAFWYTEYAFVALCIYVQLLQHFELRLWQFAGAAHMPYMCIVSRFSICDAVGRMMGGPSNAYAFMGIPKSRKTKAS